MRRVIAAALLVLLGLYLLPAVALWAVQDGMIFPAPTVPRASLDRYAAMVGATPIDLVASDGVKLYGWHVPGGQGRAVLYLHGNGEDVSGRADLYQTLASQGWDALVVAYRGYPGSDGHPSEQGAIRDARALWDYATLLGIPPDRIVVHGRSLGGGVATGLVAQVTPAGLVLESTFTSIADMAKRSFPIYPVRWILRHPFDSRERASKFTLPVLILHGDVDRVIPVAHGRALARAIPGAEYVEVPGSDHNVAAPVGTPVGKHAYDAFLARVVQ